ncbi:MAG TPA: DUF4430 domain-containing protein [Solirubrobacterales bacterium]|jgi:hypothetical protein|nr:DUF4430 domain-containing protein [Solirubrobacterales bacterium]
MRKIVATLTVAFSIVTLAAPVAQAAPAEVNVRIEGREETLFEGPILTAGHAVEASSDSAPHGCDGLNNGANPLPGPTPTAASVDAMSILGEDFDGQWYPGFDDYFIERWGPDGQDEAKGEYWGLLVNNVFTDVGGCQYELDGGDEILWVYDAFKTRPLLALFPASYSAGARPLTAVAELGQPFEVEVDAYEDAAENDPPAAPQRTGASPFEGAEVAPVATDESGFQRVEAESAATVVTGADGTAEIVFAEPGWHRIKATVTGSGGGESAVRSNRLDVCVPAPPATDCGALPAEDQVRTPPPSGGGEEEPEPETGGEAPQPEGPGPGGGGMSAATPFMPSLAPGGGQVRLEAPRLDRRRLGRGLLGVSWRVLDPGVGIGGWTISSRTLGRKGAPYVVRARGTGGTSALLRLPGGAAYRLRFTVVDAIGRSSTVALGRVAVPGPDG